MLQLAAAEERFAVHDAEVRCPPEVGWLREQPPLAADPDIAERLRQAAAAEFARNDLAAARAQFDELLGPQGPRGDDALPCVLAAAWSAHRIGDAARCDELAGRLAAACATLTPSALAWPATADVVAGLALLGAARGAPPPPALATLLPALPERLSGPLYARFAERGHDVEALAAATTAMQRRRADLAVAQDLLRQAGPGPFVRAAAGRLVLYFPEAGAAGRGTGAVAGPPLLRRLASAEQAAELPSDLPAVPHVDGFTFAEPAGDHEVVVPDFAWVMPGPAPERGWLAHPAAVAVATLALVGVFAGSLWFAARALRRETLAMRARSDFLTGVTHELKTPVASIRLVADVLAEDEVPPGKQREYFALLAGEAARLSMLIDNVLDLGQIERGERAYDVRPGDLAAVVRDAVRLFVPLAQRAGLQLALHEGAAAAAASFDEGALRQALLAVFENARKYAAAGGRIDVTTAVRGAEFVVEVRDFGPGVPPSERQAVFERFARGAAHRHGSIPGTGLGLYLARSIVERHGGQLVCVEPATGPGAVFRFTLPSTTESP